MQIVQKSIVKYAVEHICLLSNENYQRQKHLISFRICEIITHP